MPYTEYDLNYGKLPNTTTHTCIKHTVKSTRSDKRLNHVGFNFLFFILVFSMMKSFGFIINKMLFKKDFTIFQMFKPYISNLYLITDKAFVN